MKFPVTPSETSDGRLWRLAAVTLATILCLYVSIVQLNGVDFWLQAKIGEIIVRDGTIPGTLLFPFTEAAVLKFNAHEWLTSILFHLLQVAVGENGMPFLVGFLGLLFFYLTAWLAYLRSGANAAVALLFGIIALLTENYRHVLRPELISLLLMCCFWISLEKFKTKPSWKHAVFSTFIVILWVNSHGSFILAPLLTAIYAIGIQFDRLILVFQGRDQSVQNSWTLEYLCVTHLAACLINPFGIDLLRFVAGFSNDPALSMIITEWSPTLDRRWFNVPGFWLAGVVWVGTLSVVLKYFRRLSAVDVLLFLLFSALAVKAIRFPLYLGLASAVICTPYIGPRWQTPSLQTRLYQWITGITLILGGVSLVYGNAQGRHPYSTGFGKLSDQMVRTLKNPIYQGNVLTSMELGAELIYHAYPRLRPSIDCRIDSYGLEYLYTQERLLYSDAQLQEFVRRYDVQYMLMDRARLREALQDQAWRSDRWVVIDMDKSAVFLRRADVRK